MGYNVARNPIGTVPNEPLASARGKELHPPIFITLVIHGVQDNRERERYQFIRPVYQARLSDQLIRPVYQTILSGCFIRRVYHTSLAGILSNQFIRPVYQASLSEQFIRSVYLRSMDTYTWW